MGNLRNLRLSRFSGKSGVRAGGHAYNESVNIDEQKAQEYFLHLGYKEAEVPFEPEGQGGPDFVIKGRIAVEVTRLNRHVRVSAKGKRLGEEDADRVYKTVEQVLCSLGPGSL
jgi:hypothetical protein